MSDKQERNTDIVRITGLSFTSGGSAKTTIYGINRDGNEQVYTEFDSEEAFREWQETDSLWIEAQGAMFDALQWRDGSHICGAGSVRTRHLCSWVSRALTRVSISPSSYRLRPVFPCRCWSSAASAGRSASESV